MESGLTRKVRDHRPDVQNRERIRDIINARIQPPPTVEEILAVESARLGVLLAVKKEEK